jgi:hypothetical protein
MCTMIRAPPPDTSLDCACAGESEEQTQGKAGGVASVAPETVVPACDAEGGAEVVEDGPDEGGACERCAAGEVEAEAGDEDNEGGVKPAYLLVPVV